MTRAPSWLFHGFRGEELSFPAPGAIVTDYDHYFYDGFPFAETHPDRLAALALLFGLHPPPIEHCRVLDLGCGLGRNLLPLAAVLPQSSFLGIDRAARPIELAQSDVRALGLGNIDFLPLDILEADERLGMFDYIVCHGVYSWVPPPVQAKILAICRNHLAPSGIAYISFNTYPGWCLRGMLRDMLRREAGSQGAPEERVARARTLLRFLSNASDSAGPAQAWLKTEIDLLDSLSDRYLYYEYLVEENYPIYFADFAASLENAGLQYLADAHFHTMIPEQFGPEAAQAIAARGGGPLGTEQSIDLLDLRYFRRALVCHAEAPVNRHIGWERLVPLFVSSSLAPGSEAVHLGPGVSETFSSGAVELATWSPWLKAALMVLSRHYPAGVVFETLCAQARALVDGARAAPATPADKEHLGKNLLGLYAQGRIELGAWRRPIAAEPGLRPRTSPWVRLQAAHGEPVCTSLLHKSVPVDSLDRALLRRMDGTRTESDLVEGAFYDVSTEIVRIEVGGAPCSDRETVADLVKQKLRILARTALIVAQES